MFESLGNSEHFVRRLGEQIPEQPRFAFAAGLLALAVIVGHWKKLTARNGILALAGARYRYTKTLWITGLADRLPRYDTLEQAIAAVSAGGNGT